MSGAELRIHFAAVKRQRKGAKLRRDAQTIALRADLKRVWREITKNPPARTPAG